MKLVSLFTTAVVFCGSVCNTVLASTSSDRFDYDKSQARDIVTAEGVVIGLYEPGNKVFKMVHIFRGAGWGKYEDRLTNTACHQIRNPVAVYIRTDRKWSGSGQCTIEDLERGIYKCTSQNGKVFYMDKEHYILAKGMLDGPLCARVITKDYLEKKVFLKQYPELEEGEGPGTGSLRETYFTGLSFDSAVLIMTQYMSMHGINEGFIVQEDVDVKVKKRGGLFRRKIEILYYEKPIYYAIVKGIGAGKRLWNDYYLLEEGAGNLYDRKNFLVYKETKSGWTFWAALVFGLGVAILTGGVGSLANLSFWSGFTTSALFQTAVYIVNIGSTGALTSNPINMQFAPARFDKINPESDGKGRDRIAERIKNSNTMSLTNPRNPDDPNSEGMKCARAGVGSDKPGCLSPFADMQNQKQSLWKFENPTFSNTERANPFLYSY